MRLVQNLGFKQTIKLEAEISNNLKKKCRLCGHTTIFDDPKIDRIICSFCKHYVYKDEATWRKYAQEEKKRQFRNNFRRVSRTFLVKDANDVTFGEACDYADKGMVDELDIPKELFILRTE